MKKFKFFLITLFVILILLSLSLLTKYNGSTDIGDYADTAKFFSGYYQAKIRTSHSYLYGLLFFPLVKLTKSVLVFKLASVIFLLLLMMSLYYMSNRNKKVLLLILISPIIWYLAPWISPIPLSSLLFLWGYYFIQKYDENNNFKF